MNPLFENLFIFEMANNHQGDVEHGIKIIKAMGKIARKHGIKGAIKFQYRDLDTLIHPDYLNRDDIKHVPRFRSTRLTSDDYLTMLHVTQEQGLITICTPFDEPSVSTILDHGIQIIKVASCSATDWPLLEKIAAAHKPVICSTGGKSMNDIDKIVSFFTHRHVDFALLHCVGLYPTPNSAMQLDFMERMQRRFPYVPVGFSGHEAPDNLDVVKIAIAKGAYILERHVGVPTDKIKLNAYSMSPEETDAWIASAMTAREICGRSGNSGNHLEKHVTQEEIESLNSLARGTYAAKPIQKGETIGAEAVYFAMPISDDNQTTSGEFQVGMVASRDYAAHAPMYERRQITPVNVARSIMHDAKGMLYEAGIEFGHDFVIELSHHYGLQHFRQTGALIVNIINREYCKKLIIVLPGQKHPKHKHELKEETFQLLWGDLTINLNGTTIQMKPGDKLLVERGDWHSFTSTTGAIFEEVSTTHVKGDSYYEDPQIASNDPMLRKTVLEDW